MSRRLIAFTAILAILTGCASSGALDDRTSNAENTYGGFDVETEGAAPWAIEIGDVVVEAVPTATPVATAPPTPAQRPNPPPSTPAPTPTPTPVPEPAPCSSYLLTGPTFATDSADLTTSAKIAVNRLAERIAADSSCSTQQDQCSVIVVGHTDHRPTDRRGGNDQLSYDRARSVAEQLTTTQNIPVAEVLGAADNDPPQNQTDLRNWRRVEIMVLCA